MKHTLTILSIICTLICAATLYGCSDSADEPAPTPGPEPTPTTGTRTLLVYMVADNNLAANAVDDLEEMSRGMRQSGLDAGSRLLVFFSGTDHQPRLIEIDTLGVEHTLKTYDTTPLAVSIERMSGVIADMKTLAPAASYGLVLWSHATGWMSEEGEVMDQASRASMQPLDPLSFGYDGAYNGRRMKLSSLAKALEGTHFDYIYFDCCHMATVEVAYELRSATDRIIASATELGIEGMPYHLNLRPLMAVPADLPAALANTFSFYSTRYDSGQGYGCSITNIDTRGLDRLAAATRAIYDSGVTTPQDYNPVRYFRYGTNVYGIYDMPHNIDAICSDLGLLAEWHEAFGMTVAEHRTTQKVFTLNAEHFSGLGCHIIRSDADVDFFSYTDTRWWTDVASHASY